MIRLEAIYVLMGLMLAGIAIVNFRDMRSHMPVRNTAFWALYAVIFLFGSHLGDFTNGILVLLMVLTASRGLATSSRDASTPDARAESAARWGNRLFVPVLVVPVATFLGSVLLGRITIGGTALVDPKQVTQVALGLATVLALITALVMLRPPIYAPITEARRLMDSVGWAAVLPQALAALGALFATAGVGKIIAELATTYLPLGTPTAAVVAYAVGMALFTIIMGNAFAAFPVMTAGIGLPLVVQQYQGDVVIVTAIGMLSGFCGTLMTPMAANFNIVPAALLELRDRYGVIKAQVPTALMLLAANIVLLAYFAFPR
jgi:uncharacterized membrane protein